MEKGSISIHEFAFYTPITTKQLSKHLHNESFILKDSSIYHRVINVLKLLPGDSFILFDQLNHAQCLLQSTKKKNEIHAILTFFKKNPIIRPSITFLLPLLKREAFQEAIYSLTELGATIIQPIITANIQRKWGGNQEYERLQRIVHAAAEQSKNFAFPLIEHPKSLEQILKKISTKRVRIYCDPKGQPLLHIIQQLLQKSVQNIVLMVGPEADLTSDEKKSLKKHHFTFCALTPTILRTQQAAALSLGIFRSLFGKK